mmetsp:Transcript_30806/g.69547  ORF Transcript_30806/g.69547 Transcript_30806/m.69547 type:complete len:302 (-) Transcript_30806:77-982(-)
MRCRKPLTRLGVEVDGSIAEQGSDTWQIAGIFAEVVAKLNQLFNCVVDEQQLQPVTFHAVGCKAEALTAHHSCELKLQLLALVCDNGEHLFCGCVTNAVGVEVCEETQQRSKVQGNLLHDLPAAPPANLAVARHAFPQDGLPAQLGCPRLWHKLQPWCHEFIENRQLKMLSGVVKGMGKAQHVQCIDGERHQAIDSVVICGAAIACIRNTIIEIEPKDPLQGCQYQTEERVTIHVDLGCFKGDKAHADDKIVCDTASHHVHSLTKSRCAIKNQCKVLLKQFLHDALDLTVFNLRDVQLRKV